MVFSYFNLIINIFFYTVCFCGLSVGLFGRLLGYVGSIVIIIVCQLILFIILIYLYIDILKGKFYYFYVGDWVFKYFGFSWTFLVDTLSVEMGLVICVISTLVILFAFEYMETDPHLIRFLCYLVFFSLFMLFYVFSGNLLQIFLGWEGVGLVSFLLVNFWFTRLEANRSAVKAILFNRIGDICFIFFMVIFVYKYKNIELPVLLNIILINSSVDDLIVSLMLFGFVLNLKVINILAFLIFLAAAGKSAQLGLHAWLPDAMEGPTPVSALLHSATMVTAGVFLLIRFSTLFAQSDLLSFIAIIGGLTAFISAVFACFQFDLKKIIAYSTCSQLGFMVVAFSSLNSVGAFYHLYNHAFFKALLFLCAGSIIHSLSDEQDIRKMGGLLNYLPYTYTCMLLGSLGLIGFPFFAGFYSKEVVIFNLFNNLNSFTSVFVFILICCSSLLTIYYSYKIISRVFFLKMFRGFKVRLVLIHEPSVYMSFSMFLLSLFSILVGFFFEDFFVGVGSCLLVNWYFLSFNFDVFTMLEKDIINSFLKFFFVSFFFYLLYYFFFFKIKNYLVNKNKFLFLLTSQIQPNMIELFGSSYLGFSSYVYSLSNFFLVKSYFYVFYLLDRGLLNKNVFDLRFYIFYTKMVYYYKNLKFINLSLLFYFFFSGLFIIAIYFIIFLLNFNVLVNLLIMISFFLFIGFILF